MNPNYSYLENNPMFIRMLNAGNPYLGFSSVLRTPSLEGMSALEFSSPHQLNQKLEEMPQLILNKELLASKESLAGIVNHSVDDFYNHLLARQDDSINNDFHKSIQPYESLLDQHFATLFESQKDRLQECLTRLLREDFQHITPETFSTLIERPYFQKMIPLYHQFKENP
ncbi:MAG: hypothetical protein IPJ69_03200 [Deltaproteobacteria bacterium]|nr:MAG: hypothetical protein IPJ69_03200 [Deltaproteobacteria bacterium]